MHYYISVLNCISHTNRGEVKKLLQGAYKAALFDLGTTLKAASYEQKQKACLLGTLYFVKALQAERKEKADADVLLEVNTPRLNDAIRSLKNILGRDAKMEDFAAFVQQSLHKGSKYHKVLFYQDNEGIYLYYKEYWPAFQEFCKEQNITLMGNSAWFQREVLRKAGCIKPQYEVFQPGKYLRYDYRKKVGDTKATVLNISPKILKIKKASL